MANKKMNFSVIKAQESKIFTQKKVICGKYEVLVDEVFRESKMLDLMKYFLSKMTYMQENNLDIPMDSYALVLTMKFFTDIEMPDEVEKQIQMINALLDLGYFETIFKAFDQKEIDKLTKKIMEYSENVNKLIDEIKAKNESENKEDIVDGEVTESGDAE